MSIDFDNMKQLITSEPDYIALKRFEYSLKKLLVRYPTGAPNHVAAQALMMTEEEFENLYQSIVLKLKESFK